MANQNVYTNLINAGNVSRLNNFNENIIDTEVNLLAQTFPAVAQDGKPTLIFYTAVDTRATWKWIGGETNTDPASAGVNTSWFEASPNESEIVVVTAPPIDSWDGDTLVVASLPVVGMTANTNELVWIDSNNVIHTYNVEDPMGTPIFTEITTNILMRVDDTSLNNTADVLALSPLRKHTIYFNSTTGQEWLVDENGEVTVLNEKNRYGEIEFEPVLVVAGTPSVFDINLDASITIQDEEVAVTGTNEYAMTANTLVHGVEVLDADNGLPLNTNNYRVTPITTSTFQIEVNSDANVKVIFGGILGK